jgi:pseudomonalisin
MRRAAIALSVAAVLVPVGLAAGVGTAADAATPQPAGLAPLLVNGQTLLGALAPTTQVPLTLSLALRDKAALDTLVAEHTSTLTPAEFTAEFAPAAATVSAVTGWAQSAGLTVRSVSSQRTLVNVVGSVASVDKAFGVNLAEVALSNGSTVDTTTTAGSVPAAIAGDLDSVVGITGASVTVTAIPKASTAASVTYGDSYNPQQFWSIYNAPASETGQGQTLAVIAEGDLTGVVSDLRQFETLEGLPEIPTTIIPAPDGSTDTSNSDEFDLDSQYSSGFAPDASQLLLYDGDSLSDADILNAVDTWVSQDQASQASFSAGECEVLAEVAGFTTSLDAVLEQADAQGQTLFVSSGDSGGYCQAEVGENGVPAGVPDVLYPAASPYAIGAGGTSLVGTGLPSVSGVASLDEIGWYAGGGGISLTESAPSWQTGVGGSFVDVGRGVPDVSLDADPESGYNVIVSGSEEVIGGTSASAPSWQGIWARAEGAHGDSLGFAGPVLYGLPASAFNDITVGDNGLFPCTPGYDYVTGRGTPDISAVVADS